MLYQSLLLLHISSASVALLSGFMAMVFRKGSGLHGAAGTIFFVSMLGMSGTGAYIATFIHPNNGTMMGGVLAGYLVVTAWVAARRRERRVGLFDWSALIVALALATVCATWGLQAAGSVNGLKDGYPAALYFVFGSIALLFAASDVRMLVRGGVFGGQRIARHLWRMCLALLFATYSFYPGQPRLFPAWLRDTNLLYVPHVLLIGSMLLWRYRVSSRRRAQQSRAIDTRHGEAAVSLDAPQAA